ncbi:exonuclease RecJ [Desulfuromusa kysingii]|uniref:Single-stranded-DNA-specific exonuclease RecJ n=1 Tax=Desulfuromusa kysingii TaxID=37625 RepID=A0A1H3YE93_9BACT|nr:single-stranded-DNA-specific exonuclease RecJ [Desulfuromusa kysingii]SEA09222.1 exonuclease RecJ [Desulfuromusa kysingii]
MQPVNLRKWKLRAEHLQQEQIESLGKELDIQGLTAQVLTLRGVTTQEQGAEFLRANLSALPDPDSLPDMSIACARLEQALNRGEKIAVHGDYDVDGITGCTLLVETLRALGGHVEYHIPLRLTDGYGLSAAAIQHAAEQGCAIILSVDCGVSAQVEAELASELGLDLIVTDHHQPPDQLPPCHALINPQLIDEDSPWKDLSGVGVAFFLLIGLRRRLRENGYFTTRSEPDLRQGLDLVALGTIADIVPLKGINRLLVRCGLQLLEAGTRPGIKALKRVADVKKVSSGVVGFRLAPRLNAAGRLEDASLGVKLLLGDDPQDIEPLAEMLDEFNRDRQKIEQQTLLEAISQVEQLAQPDAYSLVLSSPNWHSGVIGIVASRLVERYHRPTVLIALEDGLGKGSARSIAGFHLYQALSKSSGPLVGFGGHAMAAGLSIAEANLPDFKIAFEAAARSQLSAADLLPVLYHDGEMSLSTFNLAGLKELETLNPYGAGNPQPTFISRNCQVNSPRVLADKHLKFDVEQQGCRLNCIAFGQAEKFEQLHGAIDLLYRPQINQWRGVESMQLQVIDFRETGRGDDD